MLGPAELPSRLDILSDSMMGSSALNEVPAPSSSEGKTLGVPPSISLESSYVALTTWYS